MLLHILLFDKAYGLTYWVNYSELRGRLRRRFSSLEVAQAELRPGFASETLLGLRLHGHADCGLLSRGRLLHQEAPQAFIQSFVEERKDLSLLYHLRGALRQLSLLTAPLHQPLGACVAWGASVLHAAWLRLPWKLIALVADRVVNRSRHWVAAFLSHCYSATSLAFPLLSSTAGQLASRVHAQVRPGFYTEDTLLVVLLKYVT